MENIIHHCLVGVGQNVESTSDSGGRMRNQLLREEDADL
jgi:hypothetical protein